MGGMHTSRSNFKLWENRRRDSSDRRIAVPYFYVSASENNQTGYLLYYFNAQNLHFFN